MSRRFEADELAEYARIRLQITTPTVDPAFLLVASDKAPRNPEPRLRPQANPAAAQQALPSSTISRQSSFTAAAAAAPSKTSWDAEYVDLDEYEDVSPPPKKATRPTGSEPRQPLRQPPPPAVNHLAPGMPNGINITINVPPAAPAANSTPWGPPAAHYAPSFDAAAYQGAYGGGYNGGYNGGYGGGYNGGYGGGYPPAPYPVPGYGPAGWGPAPYPPPGLPTSNWPPSGWPPSGYAQPLPASSMPGPACPPQPHLIPPGMHQQAGHPPQGLKLRRSALIDEDDD